LENAWLNEKNSPEILKYEEEMIELMLGQLEHMEENLKQVGINDFRRITHSMELERIRFIISSYLRCRLQKIEDFTQHFLNEEEQRSTEEKRLSAGEFDFAKSYFESSENHFQQLILRHLPPNQDDINRRIIRPNIMSNVFFKVIKSCGTIVNTNDEEVELIENSVHMLPYQLINEFVVKGNIQLI
jgi:GINS complex subunit 4